MSAPKASVVVLTLNAGPGFGELLGRLAAQRTDFGYELLVVDSGSTDGTTELARRQGAAVHPLPQEAFDHGTARNLGASLAGGEYVAFVVQDALPVDDGWLAAMVENLDRDAAVAGVYGRQVPHPGSSPLARALVNDWPTASLERREQFAGGRYHDLPRTARRPLATFDNVSSCVRRCVWESLPFERTPFGEDLRWGKRAVEAGHKLVYEPRSAVFHSHERGALYDLRRHYADGLLLLDLFGLAPTPDPARLLLNALRTGAHLYLRLRREKDAPSSPRSLLLAARYALCSQAGAYLAVRRHRRMGEESGISARLHQFLGEGV
ncbi:MAG: Rhamnosyltransferase [uncultured Rubrobacteraceae bacterium]|uniref:Rhamnosyltransferase n=1 Tax=uncultured Rubrobacteraceae bacterium TaxID=349277 RepID=A0A6J4NEJ3_9ACTN|nr:MAG: Rhamnosyltransferase [uncultured Rubrobacteraceae bacterium]